MNVSVLVPKPEKKTWFRLSSSSSVPNVPGCYVLADAFGEILYLGLTVTLRTRFEQHLDTPEKLIVTCDGKAHHFHYLRCEPTTLEFIERSWLEQFRNKHARLPVHNKVSSPIH